jgi:hypothetical protein
MKCSSSKLLPRFAPTRLLSASRLHNGEKESVESAYGDLADPTDLPLDQGSWVREPSKVPSHPKPE